MIWQEMKHLKRVRVSRLRRTLRAQGFELRLARHQREPRVGQRDHYMIFDLKHHERVAGAQFRTCKDVEAWISEPES